MDGGLTKVEQLRERIALGTYRVDSDAVAQAILKRLLGGDDK
jgi:anti-sigma28 factor (negative regulator of flagellin synthesis)